MAPRSRLFLLIAVHTAAMHLPAPMCTTLPVLCNPNARAFPRSLPRAWLTSAATLPAPTPPKPAPIRAVSRICRAVVARVFAIASRLVPIDWFVRRFVRWLAFGASPQQLQYVMNVCSGTVPIAQSALAAAEMREAYQQACHEDACSPELQAEIIAATGYLETATEEMLQAMLQALDADGDGKLSLAEVVAAWQAGQGREPNSRLGRATVAPTTATLIDALRAVQGVSEKLERLGNVAGVAVDGAISAVDEDGDGKLSIEEVIQAPGRVAAWLGVWKEMLVKGKL